MRQVISLSLPVKETREIRSLSKKRGFVSISGYVKYLLALDKDLISEAELLKSVRAARRDYRAGKTIKADSLADLL